MKYNAIKLVSKVFKRKIAIRDWKCFHHFEEGVFLHGLLLYGNINEKTLDGPKQFSSFAKCTTIEEKLLALKPKNLDFVQAAGLPLTIETTYDGLERTGFSVGKLILVLGGVGGVGSLVI
uniref:DYW domain-containing protein n=1 Tax=Vitis vinifera TaxID=29760 RepID=F6HTY1_VITVI